MPLRCGILTIGTWDLFFPSSCFSGQNEMFSTTKQNQTSYSFSDTFQQSDFKALQWYLFSIIEMCIRDRSAAKDYPHDELWVIFQPHTYTRTKAFLPEFAKALEQADHIVLADIYAAREVDTGEVSSKDVMKLLQEDGQDVHYFPSFEEIKDFVKAHVKGHDLLITMGAGNVVEIGEELLAEK